MANLTNKNLTIDLINDARGNIDTVSALADKYGVSTDDITAKLDAMEKSATRKRVSKPSAETLANRKLAEDVAQEVIARGVEVTAKDVAEYATDAEGMPMSTRKVGALLKNAYNMGLIAKSPYNWSVAHYAPIGFDFAVKPVRKRKAKAENAVEVSEN